MTQLAQQLDKKLATWTLQVVAQVEQKSRVEDDRVAVETRKSAQ